MQRKESKGLPTNVCATSVLSSLASPTPTGLQSLHAQRLVPYDLRSTVLTNEVVSGTSSYDNHFACSLYQPWLFVKKFGIKPTVLTPKPDERRFLETQVLEPIRMEVGPRGPRRGSLFHPHMHPNLWAKCVISTGKSVRLTRERMTT